MKNIIRIQKTSDFTVISNHPIKDGNLSPEALGMLVYVLSKPDDWVVYNSEVGRRFSIGRKKFDRIMAELKDAGYVQRERRRDGTGAFYYETIIHEVPLAAQTNRSPKRGQRLKQTAVPLSDDGLSDDGLSDDGLSDDGKRDDIPSTDLPSTDLPSTERESTEGEKALSLSLTSEKAISSWSEITGLRAKKPQQNAINGFVETVSNFDHALWQRSIESATSGGCNPANIEAIRNTYLYGEGDYGKWMKLRRNAEDGGWESVTDMLAAAGEPEWVAVDRATGKIIDKSNWHHTSDNRPWYTDEERRLISQ